MLVFLLGYCTKLRLFSRIFSYILSYVTFYKKEPVNSSTSVEFQVPFFNGFFEGGRLRGPKKCRANTLPGTIVRLDHPDRNYIILGIDC